MMASLQRWDTYDWNQAQVVRMGKDAYMVKMTVGTYYGPWGTRKEAEAWLRGKREEA